MKIEELSIGDWVCAKLAKWENDDADKTPPLQVKRIDGTERHNLYVDLFNPANNTIEHSAFVEDLIPIPLTPEILEKNGCLHTAENRILCDWFDGRITVRKYNSREWYELFVGSNQMKFKLMFVHQLQHALRLAGIDKEIEL